MPTFDDVSTGGTSTANWIPVPQSAELVMGQSYRARFTLLGPYNADTPSKIKAALKFGEGLNNALASQHLVMRDMVTIDNVTVSAPDDTQRFYSFPVFNVFVDFRKTGPGTPVLVVVGIIVAVLLFAAGLAFVVTDKAVFQRVKEGGEELRDIVGTALVPLALAVALVFYFARR